MPFSLPALPYSYDALEPHIDARTMEIHHTKHHAAYVSKLNDAIKNTPMENESLETLIATQHHTPAIRNNGGGHWNHSLFWQTIHPSGGGEATGKLAEAIHDAFGSFEGFREQFIQKALTQFGSGWAWLCRCANTLCICSTANQDNPLIPSCCPESEKNGGSLPLLGVDVWEHAYYLKYQNRRPEYLQAFFNVIDWAEVGRRFEQKT